MDDKHHGITGATSPASVRIPRARKRGAIIGATILGGTVIVITAPALLFAIAGGIGGVTQYLLFFVCFPVVIGGLAGGIIADIIASGGLKITP